jgi:hypothetical protein
MTIKNGVGCQRRRALLKNTKGLSQIEQTEQPQNRRIRKETMKLASRFEAGADTSNVFRQLLEAMVDRVRGDLTISYTEFRDRVCKRKSYNVDSLQKTFWKRGGDKDRKIRGSEADYNTALRFLVEEHITDDGASKDSESRLASDKAYKSMCRAENTYGEESREGQIARRNWRRAYKKVEDARTRHYMRKYFPLPIEQSDLVIAALVEERIKHLFDSFIEKQTEKINDIIKVRAGSVAGVVEDTVWEAYLNFDLVDGTHFEMKMKIKSVVSCCGTPFFQFPTTFHNAHTGSGEKCWGSEYALKHTL